MYSCIQSVIHLSIDIYLHTSIYAYIHTSIHPSLHPSRHPFMYTSIHSSLCTSMIHPSIHLYPSSTYPIISNVSILYSFGNVDNCCNLHKYCMLREPLFFKDTKFVIDRLHYASHRRCSSAYDPYLCPELLHVYNSQLCEQINSRLNTLTAQLSRFGLENWLHHVREFLFLITNTDDIFC